MKRFEIKVALDEESQRNAHKLVAAPGHENDADEGFKILSIVFEKSDAGYLKVVAMGMFSTDAEVSCMGYPVEMKGGVR